MELIEAVKEIRKELLIKDEPEKALMLLDALNMRELDDERKRSYGIVKHIHDHELYKKYYGMHGEDQIPDCEDIESRYFITKAGERYARYGWIVQELVNEKAESYLDLACYIGSLVTTAASMGVKATGVDMTKRAIEVAKERAEFAGLSCDFFCDDATTFDKVKADIVSAFEVIEHVPDPKQFVEHLAGLANKWVYITTPNRSYGNGEGNLGHWDWDGVELHVRGHVRVFSKASMFKLMNDASMEIGYLEVMPDNLIWCKFRKAQ